MRRSRQLFIRRQMIALAALFAALAPFPAQTATLKTIYTFCSKQGCADGADPFGGIVRDSAGSLYGTTADGGADKFGTVFKLTPGAGGKWKEQVLHSFCTGCDSVGRPFAGVIVDTAGNIYGTASEDGSVNGAVYELTPKATGGYKFHILYSFCAQPNCTDGSGPRALLSYVGAAEGLPYDGHSTLFGVTFNGGALGGGTVFSLTPGGRHWSQQVLHDLCAKRSCSDSKHPEEVIADASGLLFGAAQGDRKTDFGTLFELAPSGNARWNETVLYRFCQDGGLCSDGKYPGGLLLHPSGSLWGVAAAGGPISKAGVQFQLAGAQDYSILHAFCSLKNCADGWWPQQLQLDGAGNTIAATARGGIHHEDYYGEGAGTIYRLGGSGFETLYSFCSLADCTDGEYPRGALALDAEGNIFGVTSGGGQVDKFGGSGTVFQLSP